jgi:hypothetical protein
MREGGRGNWIGKGKRRERGKKHPRTRHELELEG